MEKSTVAREIFKKLCEIGEWVPAGEMEKWNLLRATGSTITRKARLLQADKWLAVRYQKDSHHAEYRANRTQAERDAYIPVLDIPQAPKQFQDKPLGANRPKVRFEPIFVPGQARPIGVREVIEKVINSV